MTGDPLDRIEERLSELSAASLNVDDVLALVTVARAAREHLEHTRGFCVDKDSEADLTCPSFRRLRAALARLDGAR